MYKIYFLYVIYLKKKKETMKKKCILHKCVNISKAKISGKIVVLYLEYTVVIYGLIYFYNTTRSKSLYLFNHHKIATCWIKNNALESRMYFYFTFYSKTMWSFVSIFEIQSKYKEIFKCRTNTFSIYDLPWKYFQKSKHIFYSAAVIWCWTKMEPVLCIWNTILTAGKCQTFS